MKTVYLTLPFPPSVNNLFPEGRRAKSRVAIVNGRLTRIPGKQRRFPSKCYQAWRETAGLALKQAGVKPIKGPVTISLELAPRDARRRDADNYNKAILDLLVRHNVIEADDGRIVRAVSSRWVETAKPPVARVTITPA